MCAAHCAHSTSISDFESSQSQGAGRDPTSKPCYARSCNIFPHDILQPAAINLVYISCCKQGYALLKLTSNLLHFILNVPSFSLSSICHLSLHTFDRLHFIHFRDILSGFALSRLSTQLRRMVVARGSRRGRRQRSSPPISNSVVAAELRHSSA